MLENTFGAGATYGPGTPLSISGNKLWRGQDRTNGFNMRNVDHSIPSIRQSMSSITIDSSNVLADDGVIPHGNALWRDLSEVDVRPGATHAQKPAKALFAGVAAHNQGYQTGHPVQGWGTPAYATLDMVQRGFIAYKHCMPMPASAEAYGRYLRYIKGDREHDVTSSRRVYEDWIKQLAEAEDGSRLALWFLNANGFPFIDVVPPSEQHNPRHAFMTFGGWAEIFEPENEAVIFSIGWGIY